MSVWVVGDTVVSGSNDETVRLWDARMGDPLHVVAVPYAGELQHVVPCGRDLVAVGERQSCYLRYVPRAAPSAS